MRHREKLPAHLAVNCWREKGSLRWVMLTAAQAIPLWNSLFLAQLEEAFEFGVEFWMLFSGRQESKVALGSFQPPFRWKLTLCWLALEKKQQQGMLLKEGSSLWRKALCQQQVAKGGFCNLRCSITIEAPTTNRLSPQQVLISPKFPHYQVGKFKQKSSLSLSLFKYRSALKSLILIYLLVAIRALSLSFAQISLFFSKENEDVEWDWADGVWEVRSGKKEKMKKRGRS